MLHDVTLKTTNVHALRASLSWQVMKHFPSALHYFTSLFFLTTTLRPLPRSLVVLEMHRSLGECASRLVEAEDDAPPLGAGSGVSHVRTTRHSGLAIHRTTFRHICASLQPPFRLGLLKTFLVIMLCKPRLRPETEHEVKYTADICPVIHPSQ